MSAAAEKDSKIPIADGREKEPEENASAMAVICEEIRKQFTFCCLYFDFNLN